MLTLSRPTGNWAEPGRRKGGGGGVMNLCVQQSGPGATGGPVVTHQQQHRTVHNNSPLTRFPWLCSPEIMQHNNKISQTTCPVKPKQNKHCCDQFYHFVCGQQVSCVDIKWEEGRKPQLKTDNTVARLRAIQTVKWSLQSGWLATIKQWEIKSLTGFHIFYIQIRLTGYNYQFRISNQKQ